MTTSKERVLSIVRLEQELRSISDDELAGHIVQLGDDARALLQPWCPADQAIDVPALRGAMTRGRLKGVPDRVADALSSKALEDCIAALGDAADHPSETDLARVLPAVVERHGVKITRVMLALAIVGGAPAAKVITKVLKTDPALVA